MQLIEIADNVDFMANPLESMMQPREQFRPDDVHTYLKDIFAGDVHAKRVLSLAKATTGVLSSGSLAVAAIGQGMAHTCGTKTKHAVKQVDRLVGNDKVDVWDYFRLWVPHVVAERQHIVVAVDWTDFSRDGHQTVSLNLLTSHGRAIPLVWRTVESRGLKGHRNEYEDSVLRRLHEVLPEGVAVTVIADRGFFDVELLEVLRDCWGFGYVVRMRGNIQVESAGGETRSAAEWVGAGGCARLGREDLLGSERDRRRVLGRECQCLVERVRVERLTPPQHGRQSFWRTIVFHSARQAFHKRRPVAGLISK